MQEVLLLWIVPCRPPTTVAEGHRTRPITCRYGAWQWPCQGIQDHPKTRKDWSLTQVTHHCKTSSYFKHRVHSVNDQWHSKTSRTFSHHFHRLFKDKTEQITPQFRCMCRIIDKSGNTKKSLKFFWIAALPYVSRQKVIKYILKGFTDVRSSFKAFGGLVGLLRW
jgi:hypothetical protein